MSRSRVLEARGAGGITAITVKGFKSLFNSCSIDIAPLTILAGANSAGKSSMMQPLLLLKQTLEASYDPKGLLLDGPNVRFTATDQLFSKSPGRKTSQFELKIKSDSSDSIKSMYEAIPRMGVQPTKILSEIKGEGERTALFERDMTDRQIKRALEKATPWVFPPGFLSKGKKNELKGVWQLEDFRGFFRLGFIPESSNRLRFVVDPYSEIREGIINIIHVPAMRGNPKRNYETTTTGPRFPGTFQNYTASLIHGWQESRNPRIGSLGKYLQQLGLTWKVDAKLRGETRIELRVGRLVRSQRGGAYDLVSIADVGFGISQVLPVLVALLEAEPGQLVYLEQPEIHLHPQAQVELGRILLEAATRGVRVVVETHSARLLLALRTLVADGEFEADNVKLHWFDRNPETGITTVTTADLDRFGAVGDWPENLADIELSQEAEYLDVVEKAAYREPSVLNAKKKRARNRR